ncbi:hypothetical protein IFO70_32765 [Phormidium tenue FACHB-886]|nr:hypothetical protein [Phormidium tenue FACHB-886]
MNRAEAKRLLQARYQWRWGRGDHLLFFDGDQFVFGLAVCTKSNQKDLPRSVARRVKDLCR